MHLQKLYIRTVTVLIRLENLKIYVTQNIKENIFFMRKIKLNRDLVYPRRNVKE